MVMQKWGVQPLTYILLLSFVAVLPRQKDKDEYASFGL